MFTIISNAIKSVCSMFIECPIMIVLASMVIFGVTGVVCDNSIQNDRLGSIPLIFSEIGQTKRNYAKLNQPVPPTTLYYGAINDIAMKVFEANNIAFKHGYSDRTFAQELEFKTDKSLKVHHQISEYASELSDISKNALDSLSLIDNISKDITPAILSLRNTWDEDHDDVYHTEYYTVTVTDSNGKSRTETRSRRVYDYTIHTYTYSFGNGLRAKELLESFDSKYIEVSIDGLHPIINETGAENEDAISQSIRKEKNKMVTSDEAKSIVQQNYSNSTLIKNTPIVIREFGMIKKQTPMYSKSTTTAKSCRYRTYSHSDSGPIEFQIAQNALNTCVSLRSAIDEIVSPIKSSNAMVHDLEQTIYKYIRVSMEGEKGDVDELREHIMTTAKTIYKENFKAGVDVETYSILEAVGSFFLGLIIGGLIGALIIIVLAKNDIVDINNM